ncbi:DUF3618 domain-containing protein [Nonomuraea sp. SYSU D8015]|uniref:DUF3618 domain-containing protein n=1 Tax=Nonomuraea sp. SYSU D8015 TaxID=2593644 RepID=UPI0016610AAA|nr:DUF3618 domain-containing protein [Nonomuraea sp. SYSU D8015]
MTISGPSHRAGEPATAGPPRADEQADSREELRADIVQTREHLADTVETLAAKADLKTRAKDKTRQVKANLAARAQQTGTQARTRAGEFTAKARAITSDTTPAMRRGAAAAGAAAGVAAGAVALSVWLRRRNARRQSPWQRAVHTARQSSAQVRHKATDLAGTVMTGDLAAKARQAAASPAAAPRAQGAAAAAIVLLVLGWLRRRRVLRHAGAG